MSTSPPSIDSEFNIQDIFTMATRLMSNMGDSDRQMLNSPNFSNTVETVTRDLLQNLFKENEHPSNAPLPPSSSSSKPKPKQTHQSHEQNMLNNRTDDVNDANIDVSPPDAELNPRTRDLYFDLNVTLEELYNGKTKKINVKRKRTFQQTDGSYKIIEEKKTLYVVIEKGMKNEEQIVFNAEADEIPGFETGDVIITLKELEHDCFFRCNDDLFIYKNISISEIYYLDIVIYHLDNTPIRFQNVDTDMLTEFGSIRKIPNKGMPIENTENAFGDLFVRFEIVPHNAFPDKQQLLSVFPPLNTLTEEQESVQHVYFLDSLNEDDYYKLDMYEDDEELDDYEDEDEENEDDDEENEEEEEECMDDCDEDIVEDEDVIQEEDEEDEDEEDEFIQKLLQKQLEKRQKARQLQLSQTPNAPEQRHNSSTEEDCIEIEELNDDAEEKELNTVS